jgi:hypothetical protein
MSGLIREWLVVHEKKIMKMYKNWFGFFIIHYVIKKGRSFSKKVERSFSILGDWKLVGLSL